MKRDKSAGKHSQIVRVEDERGEPGSNDGYGRKPFLYIRRELLKANGLSTRNVGYHIHTAKAPTHTMKRTEIKNGRASHTHRVIDLTKKSMAGGASITISFAPVPNGAPVPTSVTVNFNSRSKSSPSDSITVEHPETSNNGHEKDESSTTAATPTSESTAPTPPATPTAEKA
jgi:hypothetical protein